MLLLETVEAVGGPGLGLLVLPTLLIGALALTLVTLRHHARRGGAR